MTTRYYISVLLLFRYTFSFHISVVLQQHYEELKNKIMVNITSDGAVK